MKFGFRADIEALRGVAVLAVIVFHLFPEALPGGYGGVDLFFVISGYVVTYALLARQQKNQLQELGFAAFLQRRLQRIMPPLLLALLLIAAASYVIYEKRLFYNFSGYSITSLLGISNLKLISQQTDYFSPDQHLNPYLHTWSLGIEEQFYLVYPLLFLPFVNGKRQLRFWICALTLCVASFLIAWHWSELDAERAYLSPISRFWELATGVFLALAGGSSRFNRFFQGRRNFLLWAQVIAFLILLLSFLLLSNKATYPLPGVILPVFSAGVLLSFGAQVPLGVLIQCHWLRLLGRISYSLYLYHWPCIVFARYLLGTESGYWWFAALVASGVFTWFSYCFVEQGWLRQASLPQLAWVGGLGLFGLVGFDSQSDRLRTPLGLANFSRLAWSANDSRPLNQIISAVGVAAVATSLSSAEIQLVAPGKALELTLVQKEGPGGEIINNPVFALQRSSARFFVVGDSHAGSLVAAVRSLVAVEPNLVGLLVTPPGMGGCSLVSYSFNPGRCTTYEAQSLALVQRWAQPGDRLLIPSLRLPRLSPRLGFAPYVDPNTTAMGLGFEPALRQLQRQGVQIALLAPWPVYNVLGKQCLGWQAELKLECKQSRNQFIEDRQPALKRLQKLQQDLPGLEIIDPIDLFCDQKKCLNHRGQLPLYADHDHLSAYGSAALGNWLRQRWFN
jgi:peptidoglycan/LPS O-acetylase OafA/YrhL